MKKYKIVASFVQAGGSFSKPKKVYTVLKKDKNGKQILKNFATKAQAEAYAKK